MFCYLQSALTDITIIDLTTRRVKVYTALILIYNHEVVYIIFEGRRYLKMPEVEIGRVTDFFARPVVAGVELRGSLKIGDKIHIKGTTTDMELAVESMQIDRVDITEGKSGDLVGIKVPDRVRRGDTVYKVTE
jgi:tRNA(Ile2) C34 agmatinyltransferase TiaS